MEITTSAPGKFVLSGEYAVLDGAPAVCVAVDRRARVSIGPHEGDHCVVQAPGFSAEVGQFSVDSGGLNWLAGRNDYALFEAVWVASQPAIADGAVGVYLDTHQLSGWAPKLKRPSEAKIAGDPPQGCIRAIASSSSSMVIMSSSSPPAHILSSSRQSFHTASV